MENLGLLILPYLLLIFVVAMGARNRDISGVDLLFIGFFFTPLIAVICLYMAEKKADADLRRAAHKSILKKHGDIENFEKQKEEENN